MVKSLQRLDQIAKPDNFDDQKSAAAIATSEATSTDYSEFQEFIISQIKRLIHGNKLGRWYSNPANWMGEDISLVGLFEKIGTDERVTQVDLQDNRTDYITVGDKTVDRKIELDYCYEMPIAGRAIIGRFSFNHDDIEANLSNDYSFIPPKPPGIEFSAVMDGNNIKLKIVTKDVGENPTIKYRKRTITVVS